MLTLQSCNNDDQFVVNYENNDDYDDINREEAHTKAYG